MATPAQIRQAVDDKLAAAWSHIQARQTAFFNNKGRYFQGKRTHTLAPADGTEVAPDALADHPTDQAETWGDAGFVLPATLPMVLEIHVYRTADNGYGYVGIVEVTINNKTWRRQAQVGPETYRAHGWAEIVVGDI